MIVPVQRRSIKLARWLYERREKIRIPVVVSAVESAHAVLSSITGQLDAARRGMILRVPNSKLLSLRTPDGCVLDGIVVGANNAATARGVIVYLGGNAEHYEMNPLLQSWNERGFVVVHVNPRGIGESTGITTRHGLIIDAATVLSYATGAHGLGFPASKVVVFGHSIGGGIGAEAARFFPGVLVINDRSFGTISQVGIHHFLRDFIRAWGPDDWKSKVLAWGARFYVRHIACFELDSVSQWRLIRSHPRVIISSPEDRIIPTPTQLHAMLVKDGATSEDLGCVMPLDMQYTGADAHNRGLTAGENRRLFALIQRFLDGARLPTTA